MKALRIGAVCAMAALGFAHEDEQVQIDALTRLIERDPANAALYQKRGDLQFHKQRWDASLADLHKSVELGGADKGLDLLIARTLIAAGRGAEALEPLDRLLRANPRDARAIWMRGEALEKAGRPSEAAASFDKAIAEEHPPNPDHYFMRANLLARMGDRHLESAIKGLDEGMARLGPLPVLGWLAVELEARRGCHDSALARMERLKPGPGQRTDAWELRKAEILLGADRKTEARAALIAALSSIEGLPPSRRGTPAVRDAESRIRNLLAGL